MGELTLGELQRFLSIAIGVTAFLVGGVYWLHHQPDNRQQRSSGTLVQVHLLSFVAGQGPASARRSRAEAVMPKAVSATTPLSTLPQRSAPPPSIAAPDIASAPSAELALADAAALPYFQDVLSSHIGRFRHYPPEAVPARLQGTVRVVFVMNRQGWLLDLWVDKSSGYSVLDSEAVETVRRAQPLPTIPPDLPDRLNVAMPVAFESP